MKKIGEKRKKNIYLCVEVFEVNIKLIINRRYLRKKR